MFRLPKLTPLLKALLGILLVTNIAILVLANFAGLPGLGRVLALTTGGIGVPTAWQVLSYPFSPAESPIMLIVQLVFFWWFVGPIEQLFGVKRTLLLLAVSLIGGALAAILVGFVFPGILVGLGPMMNASLAAFAWSMRFRGDLNFFGVMAMKPVHLIYLFGALSVLNFIWSPNSAMLAGDLAGLGIGVGFIEWLSQPPKKKKTSNGKRRGGPDLRVVEGGKDDGPSWLN